MKIKEITKPIKYKLIVTDEEYEIIEKALELFINNVKATEEQQDMAVILHDSMLKGGVIWKERI